MTGFHFFTNGIDVTPGVTDSWEDVDISAHVPANATCAILEANGGGTTGLFKVRKNGSSDDFNMRLGPESMAGLLVALDSSQIFEAYVDNGDQEIYLIGYGDTYVKIEDDWTDVSPGVTGSWQDIDLSSYIPEDATAVFIMLLSPDKPESGSVDNNAGVRRNGSSSTISLMDFPSNEFSNNYFFALQIAKPDASRIIEGYIEDADYNEIRYIGYAKYPVVCLDDPIDHSIGITSTWTDVDVTSDATTVADGALAYLKMTAYGSPSDQNVRKNGSTDARTDHAQHGSREGATGGCLLRLIGMDAEQIFEAWIIDTELDLYLIGYCDELEEPTYINPHWAYGEAKMAIEV